MPPRRNPERLFEPTGKGRGGSATGMLGSLQPTEYGNSRMMSEGEMPRESDSLKTMGMVRNQRKVQQHGSPDGLQRALEGEMVNMLRQQNSKTPWMSYNFLGPNGRRDLWVSLPRVWSHPVDGSADSSNGFVGTLPPERHGRHGSRPQDPRYVMQRQALRKETPKNIPPTAHVSLMVHRQTAGSCRQCLRSQFHRWVARMGM